MTDTDLASAATLGAWPALIDAMPHPVWLIDAERLVVVAANQAAGALLDTAPAHWLGQPATALAATPEDGVFWREAADGSCEDIESQSYLRRADGHAVPVLRRIQRVDGGRGVPLYVVTALDRSEQQRVERALEATAAELRATFESTADGMLVADLAGRIRHFNRRFAEMWSLPEELLAQREDDAVLEWMRRSVVDAPAYMRRLAAIDDAVALHTTDVVRLRSGRVLERVTLPQCLRGEPIGRVSSFRDITERLATDDRIRTLSNTDPLTGLPNLALLNSRLAEAFATAARERRSFALMVLDLDHFKHVNQTLGTAFGDRVMVEVAARLATCVRQGDTLARAGGDRFMVLMERCDPAGTEATARRVAAALQQPFTEADLSFTVTASIGIAVHPGDGAAAEALVQAADAAMRTVKGAGRAGIRFHDRGAATPVGTRGPARTRLQLDHAMRQALAHDRFALRYQPKVDLATGAVVGAEALLRWHDDALGQVSPADFIPVAEQSGFIVALGAWVLRRALRQAAEWHAAGLGLTMAVNVSALQLRQPSFAADVAQALEEAGVAPAALELELTESVLIDDAEGSLLRLEALADLGVAFAIDDFGTGYSSLGYMKRFPIASVKIDRSFIAGLPNDASDAGIVEAIVHMGRALKVKVVAEGVETEAQRDFLERCRCDAYQGFLFAPALDAAALQARLARPATRVPAALRLLGRA